MPSPPKVSKAARNMIWLAAGLLAGCAAPKADPTPPVPSLPPPARPPATTQAAPETVATVGTTRVIAPELREALDEAYGFNMLMLLVQRDMARDACAEQHLTVTPADLKWEYDWTLDRMFPNINEGDDRNKLLEQYLAQPKPKDQTTTHTEFGIIVETNAYLRKLVTPTVNRGVTDEMLHQLFDETYGAQVRVRNIVVANPQDAATARARLDGGEDFATLARQISRDPTSRASGGELPPFTINSTRLPENFKRVAFSLKPGEVSDPVQAAGGYHLIKLEQRIPPRAVKFDDVKDSLRQDYEARMVMEGVKDIRARLAQQALADLKISDPVLKAEFDKRMNARDDLIKDREKMRQQMEKDRDAARTPPVNGPASKPSQSTTRPTTGTADVRLDQGGGTFTVTPTAKIGDSSVAAAATRPTTHAATRP